MSLRSVVIHTPDGSFAVPFDVIKHLSSTLIVHLSKSQTARIDIRGGYFRAGSLTFIRKYLESGGSPEVTRELIQRLPNDEEYIYAVRTADELGFTDLLDTFSADFAALMATGVEGIRTRFAIKDELGGVFSLAERPPSHPDTRCARCLFVFTMTDRRHHCRICGIPVCKRCSLHVELPRGCSPLSPQSYMTLLSNGFDSTKHLVCTQCEFCVAFGTLLIDIRCLVTVARVSPRWHQAALLYGRELLDIQNRLPWMPYTQRDFRRLWYNRESFHGHSRWTLRLVAALFSLDSTPSTAHVAWVESVTATRRVPCSDIYCCEPCDVSVSGGDALELLTGRYSHDTPREFAVQCLRRTPGHRLLCYLPTMVNALRHEATPGVCSLWNLLLTRAFTPDYEDESYPLIDFDVSGRPRPPAISEFCNQLYWALGVATEGDRRMQSLQQRLLVEVTRKYSSEYASELIRSLDLVTCLDAATGDDPKSVLSVLLPRLHVSSAPMRLPIDPTVVVTDFDVADMRVENSSTRPMVIPCKTTARRTSRGCTPMGTPIGSPMDAPLLAMRKPSAECSGSPPGHPVHQPYTFMYKREDVRRDWVVMSCVRLIDDILKSEGLDLNTLTYRVLPTSSRGGFIEIIPGAKTVYDIEVNRRLSLRDYIFSGNRGDSVGSLFDRFSSSMAVYSIVCYLLALGDRHKNNIMVREDGTLFHIDYGFILGKEAKLKSSIAPYMRLTREMKDAMGGESSDEYRKFEARCTQGYTILRRHVNTIYNVLSALVDATPAVHGETAEQLRSVIVDRFRPDLSPEDAKGVLLAAMNRSGDAVGGTLIDTIHRIAKSGESSCSPSSPIAIKATWTLWG